MKTEPLNIKKTIRLAVVPLLIPLTMAMSLATFSAEAAKTTTASNATQNIKKNQDSTSNINAIPTDKQIVKEAADAFKATQSALKALQDKKPKEALAALEVVSGNLHLLLARDPTLGMIPIDIQVQVLEGVTDLKMIEQLEDELNDLINDGHYQAARPIVDSLIDELRVTTTYLPLATYPAVIDKIAPLIDTGKLKEAEEELIIILHTFISEQEITPLAIVRAEGNLTEAFQLEHKGDLSKPETKNKIENLVREAIQHVKVAEKLGYGTKNDYQPLYHSIEALNEAVRKARIRGEWDTIKKTISAFKNKIVHPRGK